MRTPARRARARRRPRPCLRGSAEPASSPRSRLGRSRARFSSFAEPDALARAPGDCASRARRLFGPCGLRRTRERIDTGDHRVAAREQERRSRAPRVRPRAGRERRRPAGRGRTARRATGGTAPAPTASVRYSVSVAVPTPGSPRSGDIACGAASDVYRIRYSLASLRRSRRRSPPVPRPTSPRHSRRRFLPRADAAVQAGRLPTAVRP